MPRKKHEGSATASKGYGQGNQTRHESVQSSAVARTIVVLVTFAAAGAALCLWFRNLRVDSAAKNWNCSSVPHVDGRKLTSTEFEKQYLRSPVMFTGLTEQWRARESWTRTQLAHVYGNHSVQLRDSFATATAGGTNVAGFVTLQFGEYLSSLEEQTNPVFENEASSTVDLIDALQGDYVVPVFLKRFNTWRIFSLGPEGSGVPAHRHQENWFAQVSGRKAWLLTPPGHDGPSSRATRACYGFDAGAPIEPGAIWCVQNPGSILWVPSLWSHATCNLDGFTVGVGGQGDLSGHSPLHIAVKDGDLLKVRRLLSWKDPVADIGVNSHNHPQGKTPLHVACERNRHVVAAALIEASADVLSVDDAGKQPLHEAAAGGCTNCVGLLLSGRAKVSAASKEGKSALHWASLKGHIPLIQSLLAAGAKPDARDRRNGTPLLGAAFYGHIPAVDSLIAGRASLDERGHNQWTLLHVAAANGRASLIKWLAHQDSVAPLSATDPKGMTPAHVAALFGNTEALLALAAAGADMNTADGKGHAPLHLAVTKGSDSTVQALLELRGNVRVSDDPPGGKGLSPLRLMLALERSGLVRAAVLAGAVGPELVRQTAGALGKTKVAEDALRDLPRGEL